MNAALPFRESEPVGTLANLGGGWATFTGSDTSSVMYHKSYKAALAQAKAFARRSALCPFAGTVVFSDVAKAALECGREELAERQSEETMKRVAAQAAAEKRLEELRDVAAEEGYVISRESEKALRTFLAAMPFTKRPYITLLDNGNLRAFWEDKQAGEEVGLQFLGGEIVQYVIFARRAAEGFIARSAGRDLATNMESQIEANGLGRLMA